MRNVSRNAPIGFFDSGVGGLTVLEAVKKLLPHESCIYLGDRRHCPYGDKPPERVRLYAEELVRMLLDDGVKAITVACNTATAAAIDSLRATWPEIPFIGMEPAVKPAILKSSSGVVGVLATAGTFNGRLYRETCARFAKGVTVLAVVADDFVSLVERGETSGTHAEAIVRARVEPLLAAGADHIVLGCTHFPHLRTLLEQVTAGRARIIDSSEAVARQLQRVLAARDLLADQNQEPTYDIRELT